ncbi:MAG TPA: hypothetical protein VFG43_06025 [Geminicoccaceae bacterium]|nr:hypothetical protein [Geminicoccaceae bacterium]
MAHQTEALARPPAAGLALRPLLAPLLIGLAAFALFCIGLDRGPDFDELYHLLAARGWLETGEPRIADGVYERTTLFTILVARFLALLGDGLAVARLPSALASATLAALFFAWLRRTGGAPAAWVGTLLLVLSPFTIDFAQFVRFYALQSLAFFAGTIAVFRSVTEPAPPLRQLGLLLGAALAFAAAVYLQVTALVGLAGLGLWLALAVLVPWLWRQPRSRRHGLLLGAAALALALLALAVASGGAARILELYRSVPLAAAQSADEVWYYHFWLILYYPTLWSLFPLVALVALAVRPRPTLLALCIFGTALILHSFAAFKGTRFIAYALPFLYVVFGIALPELWSWLRRMTRAALARLVPAEARAGAAPWLERGALALVLLFAVAANTAFVRSAFLLADVRVPPQPARVDWAAAGRALAPRLASVDVLVATSELDALYFLGRHDILLNRSRLSEMGEAADFHRDRRTGRLVIGSPEALARIIACFETGLIVSSSQRWRNPAWLDDRTADFIVRRTQRLDLPASWNVRAYGWEHPPGTPRPADCPRLEAGGG